MPATIPVISLVDLRFDEIARMNDAGVIEEFNRTLRLSRTRIFKRTVRWNACRVTRAPNAVTLHLLAVDSEGTEPKRVAVFNFIPGPDFSRMR